MGWKGTVRSVNSAIKAAERESKRKERELERRRKEYNKMVELDQAQYEVDEFNNYIDRITSIHLDCGNKIEWETILDRPKPEEPIYSDGLEKNAHQKLDNYEPGFFDKLFNRTEKKKEELSAGVKLAVRKDEKNYEQKHRKYKQELKDWKDSKELARKIIDQDQEAWSKAVKELSPFSEINELGSDIDFTFGKSKPLLVKVNIHGEKIIPNQRKTLLKSGKLSKKKMPKSQFYALYQDYVCSVVLRIAGELFSLLPTSAVVITAVDDLLNPSTGHIEEQAILSVAIPRETFDKLNLKMIDPSDSMENFVYSMNFKKTKGFDQVDIVDWESLDL